MIIVAATVTRKTNFPNLVIVITSELVLSFLAKVSGMSDRKEENLVDGRMVLLCALRQNLILHNCNTDETPLVVKSLSNQNLTL